MHGTDELSEEIVATAFRAAFAHHRQNIFAQIAARNQRQLLAAAVTRGRVRDLVLSRVAAGAAVPAAGSVTKLLYSEHGRLTSNAALAMLGAAGTVDGDPIADPWVERFLFVPGLRLGGGTDEIQRNTIAERVLGLPHD